MPEADRRSIFKVGFSEIPTTRSLNGIGVKRPTTGRYSVGSDHSQVQQPPFTLSEVKYMNMLTGLKRHSPPPKFRYIDQFAHGNSLAILDIGCGNNSPSLTKQYFPTCTYDGVDIQEYNLNAADHEQMDRFFPVTSEGDGYHAIPEKAYDVVIASHVFEHMRRPNPIIMALCGKLRTGGLFYSAFPSERSLSLPSAVGTLHFSDDRTHVFVPSIREVANIMLAQGLTILYGGCPTYGLARQLAARIAAPMQALRASLFGKKPNARFVWPYYQFESCVVGILP